MDTHYTKELNALMLISLLKAHGIRKIIISPGITNISLSASVQSDPYFEIYSSVDERSAAYMACGMAAESGEPVVLSCTGATASRNYIPALTEAFYRKLPVLAVTSSQDISRTGNLSPQFIDRSKQLADMVTLSVHLQTVKDDTDLNDVNLKINRALLQLKRHGGGPVHINLTFKYTKDFSVVELPKFRVINRYMPHDKFPELPLNARILIYVGTHAPFSKELEAAVDDFCAAYNAVVLIDHSSGYRGKYAFLSSIVATQLNANYDFLFNANLLIHIGEQTGDYYTAGKLNNRMEVWRVSEDGEIRDTFRRLTKIFEMREVEFFKRYAEKIPFFVPRNSYLQAFQNEAEKIYSKIPELPFSNVWLAQKTIKLLPEGSAFHLGILNSLRVWNFFNCSKNITGFSNVGGFGIDGNVSSLVGASLMNPNKKFFGIIGDLAFFYDMNAVGNRHIKNNLRIMLVNNGRGTEFRQYNHVAAVFGEDADPFIAAAGHFGNQSRTLVKHYAEDLGFEYLSAANKEEYLQNVDRFTTDENLPRPILFEVFTNPKEESDALYMIQRVAPDNRQVAGIKFPLPPIFCGEKVFAEPARKFFGEYVNIEDENHQLNFANVMVPGRFFVFFVKEYPSLKNFLEKNGLREGVNFIDGKPILGTPLPPPSHRVIEKSVPLLPAKKPQLGFGIMRMPQLENGNYDIAECLKMIDEYMKGDFCYFDMAPGYCKGLSQSIVRELVVKRYPRESFLLATKMPWWNLKDYHYYIKTFEASLRDCGVDYFDYYLLHALAKESFLVHEKFGGFDFLKRMKELGKIRRIGFSFHDRPEVLEEILTKHPEVEFVQLQLNYFDWEDPIFRSRQLYEVAKKFGKQILVMEPIKGGTLAKLENISGDISVDRNDFARLALNFVRGLDVDIILSGMSALEHVINNRKTFSEPIKNSAKDDKKRARIFETLKKSNLIPCTACRYCESGCPKNIPIADIFALRNTVGNHWENDSHILGRYQGVIYPRYTFERGKASDCIKCGECEKRCPQKIQIRKHLVDAAKIFEQK